MVGAKTLRATALSRGQRKTAWPTSTRATAMPSSFAHGQTPRRLTLWRNVMPHLEGLGRLVAADMIGMGESDKTAPVGSGPLPLTGRTARLSVRASGMHWISATNVTLVLHDWGSVLGFDWANQQS